MVGPIAIAFLCERIDHTIKLLKLCDCVGPWKVLDRFGFVRVSFYSNPLVKQTKLMTMLNIIYTDFLKTCDSRCMSAVNNL